MQRAESTALRALSTERRVPRANQGAEQQLTAVCRWRGTDLWFAWSSLLHEIVRCPSVWRESSTCRSAVLLFRSSTWFLCGYLLHISRMVTWAYPQHNRCLLLMESVALSAHLTLRESLLELGMGEASTRMQQHLNHGMQPPPVTMLRACCRHLHRRKALQMVNGIWIEN